MKKVFDDTSAIVLKKINSEANGRLEKYKNKMSKQAYEKTLNSIIFKDLRAHYGFPEMAL
ncbi:hypothetical protein HZA55_01635 [Candidatus Poribacteria bacterium]|nr:hypothetical protein [Candidatus Poribacteria bacterium]